MRKGWLRAGVAITTISVVSAAIFGACKSNERLPPPQTAGTGGSGGEGGTSLLEKDAGPPPLDAEGLCGNQLHALSFDATNVYFVFDASGSMASPAGGGKTRFEAVTQAAVKLVRDLGPLINVGAALFPAVSSSSPCAVGGEVMPISPGDPQTGEDGPTTKAFRKALLVSPQGGTPTAKSLVALQSEIFQLEGETLILLVTDGGPNCNSLASCGASTCIANIEACSGYACCNGGNCCAPDQPAGPEGCLDSGQTIAAISAIAEAGYPVHVIGIPGSEAYVDLLNEMAKAGDTAGPVTPYYTQVEDLGFFGEAITAIAAGAVSCTIDVKDPPEEPAYTNVYLDQTLLYQSAVDGWFWKDNVGFTQIQLAGDACGALKTGQVKQVQIVSGCPTEVAK